MLSVYQSCCSINHFYAEDIYILISSVRSPSRPAVTSGYFKALKTSYEGRINQQHFTTLFFFFLAKLAIF